MEKIELTYKCGLSRKDGTLIPNDEYYMTLEEQIQGMPGDRVLLLDKDYVFAVALYFPRRLKKLIYEYGYAKEANWTIYSRNVDDESFSDADFVIRKDRYFRVVVIRRDGRPLTEADRKKVGSIVAYEPMEEKRPGTIVRPWFRREIEKKSAEIEKIRKSFKNPLTLLLIADSHYTVNGTWDDTATNVNEMAKAVHYDGIVHLGDLTDGMLSKGLTEKYAKKIISDLRNTGCPVYVTIGNHDNNYFKNPLHVYSKEEMRDVYEIPKRSKDYLDYYIDIKDKGIRLIFVESFNNNRFFRYGYDMAQLMWLKKAIKSAKKGTKFLIFTHDTPDGRYDCISVHTLNGKAFIKILEHYNGLNGYKILGLFYGHTHADFVSKDYEFPMVSVNSCKLEFFKKFKPRGAVRWYKQENSVRQDSWDTLILEPETGRMELVRFGAGENRHIN